MGLTLNEFAEKGLDRMYDSRIPEKDQCSGWFRLKNMVKSKIDITEEDLTAFHVLVRPHLKAHWDQIKEMEIEEGIP